MPKLERFAFHGTAAALSGRLVRPVDLWLDPGGASALPVEGGVSRAVLLATVFGGAIGFDSAETHAQGELHEAPVRRGARRQAPHGTQAHTGAEVRGLSVGVGRRRLTATRLRAELTALSPRATRQPSIGAMDGACFEGIAFGTHRLSVAIDRQFFHAHDTHEKLCAACEAPSGRALPRALLTDMRSKDRHPHAPLLTTIVKRLRWIGTPYPGAVIDRHTVTIPRFGQVHFGEMLIAGQTRRLTLLRLALDGDVALDAACCEVEAGGVWHR